MCVKVGTRCKSTLVYNTGSILDPHAKNTAHVKKILELKKVQSLVNKKIKFFQGKGKDCFYSVSVSQQDQIYFKLVVDENKLL